MATDKDKNLIDTKMAAIVLSEYTTAKMNQKPLFDSYEAILDMVEGRRSEKDYEWMSDINIPEVRSIILTYMASMVGQYFQQRDFVEVVINSEDKDADKKAKAAKKCLNNLLNNKSLRHYQKQVRAWMINVLANSFVALCWWEQKTVEAVEGYRQVPRASVDEYGRMAYTVDKQPVMGYDVIYDRFNYEVLDPRNVFMDNKYCYSIQEKDWIIIRSEKSYSELLAEKDTHKYVNLDEVKKVIQDGRLGSGKTETSQETYDKDEKTQTIYDTPVQRFDVLERYGEFWAIVTEEDKYGNPTKATPGIDDDGLPNDKAKLVECIMTYVLVNDKPIRIRFDPTDWIASNGEPYKPMIRGQYYLHPAKDSGMGDGESMRSLQIAINDTFNMNADREKLVLMPTLKVRKGSMDDMSQLYFEPEHAIEVNNPDDIQEMTFRDNTQGALGILSMLTSKIQQVTAIYPSSMGQTPDKASTTATAVAGADQHANARNNYKSLTYEYTFLLEFYSMILQMVYRFAKDKTLYKLMGEDAQHFSPDEDYTYSPVTSAIESEYNKQKKIQTYDQMMGRLANFKSPETPLMIGLIVKNILELMGMEFPEFKHILPTEKNKPEPGQGQGTAELNNTKNMSDMPTSNQFGLPQSNQEQNARMGVMGNM
jgi:hypothetical protein